MAQQRLNISGSRIDVAEDQSEDMMEVLNAKQQAGSKGYTTKGHAARRLQQTINGASLVDQPYQANRGSTDCRFCGTCVRGLRSACVACHLLGGGRPRAAKGRRQLGGDRCRAAAMPHLSHWAPTHSYTHSSTHPPRHPSNHTALQVTMAIEADQPFFLKVSYRRCFA